MTLPPPWQSATAAEQVRMLLAAIDRGGLHILTCERCGLVYVGFDGSRHCLPCCRPDVFTKIADNAGCTTENTKR